MAMAMGGVQSRNAAFTEGHSGGPVLAPQEPPSFLLQQQKLNPGGLARVRPSGSANGMSATQASNTVNGMLQDTGIGSAADTYAQKKWFEPRS